MGNLRGPIVTQMSAPPAVEISTPNVVQAFNGDMSHVPVAVEARITGANTLGQPTNSYVFTNEASPVYVTMYNESGLEPGHRHLGLGHGPDRVWRRKPEPHAERPGRRGLVVQQHHRHRPEQDRRDQLPGQPGRRPAHRRGLCRACGRLPAGLGRHQPNRQWVRRRGHRFGDQPIAHHRHGRARRDLDGLSRAIEWLGRSRCGLQRRRVVQDAAGRGRLARRPGRRSRGWATLLRQRLATKHGAVPEHGRVGHRIHGLFRRQWLGAGDGQWRPDVWDREQTVSRPARAKATPASDLPRLAATARCPAPTPPRWAGRIRQRAAPAR